MSHDHQPPLPDTLWHGTTRRRADLIVKDRQIRPAACGVPVVSLTGSRAVAAYFAEVSASCTDQDEGTPVVLRIDTTAAQAAGALFSTFCDTVWDAEGAGGACLWESEWNTPTPLPIGVVGAIENVQPHQAYAGPFQPPFAIPDLAGDEGWSFVYTNWRGEVDRRTVRGPITLRIGSTAWHDRDQWLMRAYDLDRQAWREYAMADVIQGR